MKNELTFYEFIKVFIQFQEIHSDCPGMKLVMSPGEYRKAGIRYSGGSYINSYTYNIQELYNIMLEDVENGDAIKKRILEGKIERLRWDIKYKIDQVRKLRQDQESLI